MLQIIESGTESPVNSAEVGMIHCCTLARLDAEQCAHAAVTVLHQDRTRRCTRPREGTQLFAAG
jgi:hypothetical protein